MTIVSAGKRGAPGKLARGGLGRKFMPGSKHSARVARSLTRCSVALALGLLLAACEREAEDAKTAASSTSNAAGSSSRANAPSNEAEPYAALADRRKPLIADATDALDETYAALGLLAEEDYDGAAEALARATGKLEVVLAAEPELALAPVAADIRTYDVLVTPEDVDTLRNAAEEALDNGRLQEGRRLIKDLASEHVFSVTSLPLATYPNALRQAAALIKNGRPQEAVGRSRPRWLHWWSRRPLCHCRSFGRNSCSNARGRLPNRRSGAGGGCAGTRDTGPGNSAGATFVLPS